jgi:hypothetical protein
MFHQDRAGSLCVSAPLRLESLQEFCWPEAEFNRRGAEAQRRRGNSRVSRKAAPVCKSLLLFQPENAPMHSVTQQRDVEVDQKAQLPTAQAQVRKKLRVMNRRQVIDGLELYYDRIGNNQVHAIPTIQSESLVNHRQGPLRDESQPSYLKFVAQALPISRFQQARP